VIAIVLTPAEAGSTVLREKWILGFGLGLAIAMALLLFRRRKSAPAKPACPSFDKPAPLLAPQASPEPSPSGQRIIRLSGTKAPSTAAEMTHQQRIAAALQRAGVPHPTDWHAADSGSDSDPSLKKR